MRATVLLSVLLPHLLLLPAFAEEPPATEIDAEYLVDDFDRGMVSLSGSIRVVFQDFELRVPDGGAVLWVDVERYKELRSNLGKVGEEAESGEVASPGEVIQSLLGPVFKQLYAEGDVTIRRDEELVRAERIYYDFEQNRAVVINAEAVYRHTDEKSALRVPLRVRAQEIRQVAKERFEAGSARVTTCLFGEPHWELTVEHLTIGREEGGYFAESEGNVLRAFDTPVFWFPWIKASDSIGLEPIRSARFGRSSRFGQYLAVVLGTAIRMGEGENERTWGEWRLEPVYRSRRGPGIGLEVRYGLDDYRGDLIAFYQRDRQRIDRVTDYEIPRDDRGRVRWQHHHVLDRELFGGRLSGIAEVSWLSDRGFLHEYYSSEARQGKAQENVGYLDWVGGAHAVSVTGKWRANEFQTQTEYRPRIGYDLFSLPIATGLFGADAGIYLSAEGGASKVRRVFDHKTGVRGDLVDRLQGRATLSMPFTLGPVRVVPEFGAGSTAYEGNEDYGRRDHHASVRVNTDFWRTWPEVESEFFELSGLRHVVDVSLGWVNRFAVTRPSRKHLVQDPWDLMDEVHAVDLRVRNRFQTRRKGAVVDWVDLELRSIFFPEEHDARPAPFDPREEWGQGIPSLLLPGEERWRHIRRRGFGPVLADLRARLRENLFLAADVWYDVETNRFETYSSGIRFEAQPELSFAIGHRAIQGDSSVLTAWIDFQPSERWGARVFQQTDFRDDGGLQTGVTLRRFFHDFLLSFTFRHNFAEDDTSFSVEIDPTIIFESERKRDAARALDFDDMRWYR